MQEYLEQLGAPVVIFCMVIWVIRLIRLKQWKALNHISAVEQTLVSVIEIWLMHKWANNQYIFEHWVVLLSGFAICLGFSLLGHVCVLRRRGNEFSRAAQQALLFFPGIYVLELFQLVF